MGLVIKLFVNKSKLADVKLELLDRLPEFLEEIYGRKVTLEELDLYLVGLMVGYDYVEIVIDRDVREATCAFLAKFMSVYYSCKASYIDITTNEHIRLDYNQGKHKRTYRKVRGQEGYEVLY